MADNFKRCWRHRHLVRDGASFWLSLQCGHFLVIPRRGRDRPLGKHHCHRCEAEGRTDV
jgi:hypothetical protein